MKKNYLFLAIAALFCLTLNAADLTGKRIYINPGHGSFGPNDRPMATIPYPALASTGMPDTCGFYESNTNLWKCLYMGERLKAAGASVMYSRTKNGPWPYQKVNGEYPDYSWDNYQNRSDYTKYNKNLSEICEEVEANNMDLFISVHSNAATDGTTSNYPLWLFRGKDTKETDFEKQSYEVGKDIWPYRWDMFAAGFDVASYYSLSNMNLRGDITFYGSSSTRTSTYSGKSYTGYLGVLKHGAIGGLVEGYFHTYQPARHRALNPDYCKMEGYGYYRGIIDYFGADKDTKGYIIGTVKDMHEKIVHKLFNYAPKTNDQWLPCNGAVVTLYKSGKKVAEYNVDTLYNGIFYFGDLEPGNDYTLDASCEGYNDLYDDYKKPLTVTANTVTFPFLYLENESYEPPKITYYDYPEPDMPAYIGLAGEYEMRQLFANKAIAETAGKTIHRVLVKNDTAMFVLAFDAEQKAYIYLVNPQTQVVMQQLSTEGMQGSLRAVGDIALTADGVLLACNYSENQYDDSQVAGGNTKVRGTFRVYKWTDLGAAPVEMFTSQYSANWYRGNIGNSMTVSGALDDFTMVVTCPTISSTGVLRLVNFQVAGGQVVSTCRNQDPNNATLPLTLPNYGWDMQLKPSPLHNQAFVIIGDKTSVTEISFNGDAQAPTYLDQTIFKANGATFFKYAKHVLMAVPEMSGDKNVGIHMYDVTNGLSKAASITTTNTTLAAADATYMLGAGVVRDGNITLLLAKDSTVSAFTMAGVEQPVIAHINAYDLNLSYNESSKEYTFSFESNADAELTYLVFYQNGKQVGEMRTGTAKKGHNGIVLSSDYIPGFTGTPTQWAVRLVGKKVPNWGLLHAETKTQLNMSRVFNTIDLSPESDNFGRIYLADYKRNSPQSGLYVVNQDYTFRNTEPLLGGNSMFGCLYRIAVDKEGVVYLSDWTDGNSGVYIANPADSFASFPNMFKGTRDGNGVITNNGVEVGSSTPGVHVYGSGKDTRLIVYNEDPGKTLVTNGLCIYNIGQEDGSILREWDKAPSEVWSIPGQANSEGNVWGCSHGIWVSQNRSQGNNNGSATSLQFFTWNKERKFSSALDPYKDIIGGSEGSAFALSADEKTLILNDAERQFMVFDIDWQADDTPVLTLRYTYKHGFGSSTTDAFRQLNFDYSGNLVATGDPGFYVFTMPTDNNEVTIPAKSSLTVEKPFSGNVEGVMLDKDELTINKGETVTLVATVMPEAATEKDVEWSSTNEAVATVSNGVVTAVKSGNADIKVTTKTGNFTATCKVTVITPVTGVTLDKTKEEIVIGEGLTLVATVQPADADNQNVKWATSDSKVATVSNGIVTSVGIGKANITVTTEEGGFTATCELTVKPIAVTGVEISESSLDMVEGDTYTLTAIVAPDNASNKAVTWSSSNESVATVANGVVTAVAAGDAVITVKTVDGEFTATCAVKVAKAAVAVTGVSLDVTTLNLKAGETATLVATVAPADADNKAVQWSSSDESVATVADGLVTAVAAGNAVITVKTEEGNFTAECAVTVELVDGLELLAVNGIYYRGGIIYNEQGIDLQVYNMNGQLIASGNGNIDMTGAQSGVYVVRTGNLGMKIVR